MCHNTHEDVILFSSIMWLNFFWVFAFLPNLADGATVRFGKLF